MLQESDGGARVLARSVAHPALAGFDAVIVSTPTNRRYLTGASGVGALSNRPSYVWVDLHAGDGTLVVDESESHLVPHSTWPRRVATYRGGPALAAERLEDLYRTLRQQVPGAEPMMVGLELGDGGVASADVVTLEAARALSADVALGDISPWLQALRLVKTADAVADHRRACEITGAALRHVFASVAEGMSDRDIVRNLVGCMYRLGGDNPRVSISAGFGSYRRTSSTGVGHLVRPGDMVWLDAGCQVNGSWSDLSRAMVVGAPSAAQQDWHRSVCDLTRACVDLVRPGARVADIARVAAEGIADLVARGATDITSAAGRVGHGVGLDYAEAPSVALTDPTVLEPGFVLTIEPGVATDDGRYHVEQVLAVTDDGHELLTPDPWGLT